MILCNMLRRENENKEDAMRRWSKLCLLLLLMTVLTGCSLEPLKRQKPVQETQQETEQETKENLHVEERETNAVEISDPIIVSTTAELIKAIAPQTHIILKAGTYNFSSLTEDEIAESGSYLNPDSLRQGELSVCNAPGLILEAEESGTVRLITENGYADVMTISLCDGMVLKGMILGHEIEKGHCDAYVLELSESHNVTVEDCGLFGCGTYGIWAQDASGLSVIGTDIYECTSGIFCMAYTTDATFDNCRFYDNDGMFAVWGESKVLVRDTEISGNRGELLYNFNIGEDLDIIRITFQGCDFRDNQDIGSSFDFVTFVDCDIPFDSVSDFSGTAYDNLIERYRFLVTQPYMVEDIAEYGEFGVIESARAMGDDAVYEMGYLIEDLSGDGIAELVVGETDGPINALFTLVDGEPQLVFEGWSRSSYVYMGGGYFYYYGSNSAAESGQGIFYLTEDATTLECDSFLFTGLNSEGDFVVYCNESGSWDPEESTKSDKTIEDFWALDSPGEALPLTPFSDSGNLNAGESKSPVEVRYLTESLLGEYDLDRVTLYDGPDACCILLTSDSWVSSLNLWSLFVEDVGDDGTITCSATLAGEDCHWDTVTPDTPIAVQLIFPGDLPAYGISYEDQQGVLHCYAIEISGEDGSLLLREADFNGNRFVLHAGW